MRDPDFILGLLRCAFKKGPSQNLDDHDKQLAQVGNDAQVRGSAAEPGPEPEPKGPKLPFQNTPLCVLCDKTVQKLRLRADHLVVQWTCEQIYNTDAGSPHAMLVSIIGQLFRQYDFDTSYIMKLFVDAKRERPCSIKTLTRLLQALIDELPTTKTVVVIIEGAALLDTKEFENFKGATLQTMRYLLEEVHNATTKAIISTIFNTPTKFKVLVASAPAPSWNAMFKPEEIVHLEAPAPPPSGLGQLDISEAVEDDDEKLDIWNPRAYMDSLKRESRWFPKEGPAPPPSGLGELDISEAVEDGYEKLDIWNPRAYLDGPNRGSMWSPKNAIDIFVDQYRMFPYPWSRVLLRYGLQDPPFLL
ncbi:uncharacterized protein TRUGW13939_08037 [Talaromyces rugulosus]|uniref:Uncharacterized protein n=1 Tax=Talaromyces rugulosus TaxID=121627 RepID=A0A7H8R5D4_TALRU|nr:uncharacterized protein TRUGW13939_08037 [Talaromyces rugulosus]QKX60891.1 hypothetical protein TRUGW13939_08037 [Talaromyces rugulosus]